jgi:hypothetical protein
MYRIRIAIAALATFVLASAAFAGPATDPGWEKLKTLVGEWQGTMKHGDAELQATVSYTLVSSGTALMERLSTPDGADMVTMYHPDGSGIMVTHYCAGGNQPRMRAEASKGDAGVLSFGFVDATNLESPKAEHMRSLVVKFVDAEHFTQEWTHRKDGKEEMGVFKYARKK